MPGSDVRVTFTGDTSQLAAASKQASAALTATGAAADKAAAGAAKAAAAQDSAADSIGKVGAASGKLAGLLGALSPELAAVAGGVGDLADSGEVAAEASAALGVSLGAVAAGAGFVLSAVALLAAAYAGWNEEAATATRLTEQQNALTAAMAPLYEDTEAAIRASRVELGLMTEAQAEMIDSGIAGLAQYQQATEATRKRLSELRASQASLSGQVGSFLGDVGEALPLQEYNVLAQVIDAATTSTDEYDREIGRLQDGLSSSATELKRNREAHAALTAAKQKGKAATVAMITADEAAAASAAAREAAEKRLADFLRQRAEAEEAYADGLASIRAMEQEANADRLSELDALAAARDEQVANLNRTLTEQLAATEGNEIRQQEVEQAGRDARLAIEQRYQRDRGAIIAEGNAAVAEQNQTALDDLAAKTEAKQEQIRSTLKSVAMAAADTVGAMLDYAATRAGEAFDAARQAATDAAAQVAGLESLIEGLGLTTVDSATLTGEALVNAYKDGKVAAEDLTEAQKRQVAERLAAEADAARQLEGEQRAAALASWESQHEAAVAAALLQIPLSIAQTLGSVPFPFNIPLAAAAGALATKAAADVAAASPPSFRSGYMPDQQLAYIEPQSEIVAPASAVQALGGRKAARDAFAGVAPSGGSITARFTMGHREFSALVQGSANRPGPLRDLTVRPSTRYDPHHRR